MRALFSCVSTYGHFLPLVPLARAFADEGHDVAFATAEEFRSDVETLGLQFLPAGLGVAEVEARYEPYRQRLKQIPPHERRPFSFRWRMGAVEAPPKLGELRDVAAAWAPDLVIHESADLAAPVVAASLEVASAHHSFGRLVPRNAWEAAAEETVGLWEQVGLEPEPFCGAFRGPYLDICPPSFQSEPLPDGAHSQLLRPTFPADPMEQPPSWLERLPDRPTVYVTLGTIFNDLSTFRLLLDALADLDCNVVATVGRDNDPAELGPLPANAIVERYVSQSFILPRAAAAVGHGGSGSTLAALAAGLPLLILPHGADQFENAGQALTLGAARMLMLGELNEEAVHEAVVALLEDGSYRAAARGVAAEIASMPSPAEVVPLLLGEPS